MIAAVIVLTDAPEPVLLFVKGAVAVAEQVTQTAQVLAVILVQVQVFHQEIFAINVVKDAGDIVRACAYLAEMAVPVDAQIAVILAQEHVVAIVVHIVGAVTEPVQDVVELVWEDVQDVVELVQEAVGQIAKMLVEIVVTVVLL